MFDLLVHTDLTEAMPPEFQHFGRLPDPIVEPEPWRLLAIPTGIHPLGRDPRLATSLIERYEEMIAEIMRNVGWNLADIHSFRVVYPYPPVQSTAAYCFPVAER